jgi:hypothetical protein
MNRTDRLEKIIYSWVNVKEIEEIIICDWSSTVPIIENKKILKYIKDYNIKLIRVEEEKFWHLCKAYNLAYDFTNPKNKILLKIDVDYYNLNFNSKFIKEFIIDKNFLENEFLFGGYTGGPEIGFTILNKKNFDGYNENFKSAHGWDDIDLHKRLLNKNIKDIAIPNIKSIIFHIDHNDSLRIINTEIKRRDQNSDISEKTLLAIKEIDKKHYSDLIRFQKYQIIENINNKYIKVKKI